MTFPLESQLLRARKHLHRRRAEAMRLRAMTTDFSSGARSRLLLVTQPERRPQSQIYPFHHYAPDLARLFDRIGTDHPGARVACLDLFAPTDLRNAARMDGTVQVYLKKHVLHDRAAFGRPKLGDTNLSDHYPRRLNLPGPEVRFPIPPGFLDKLVVGPSFVTAPTILPDLLKGRPSFRRRDIDLHARFEVNGTPWYRAMRAEADAAAAALTGVTVLRGAGVPIARFLTELCHSKVCFSPFGYGEVCWRDFEAVMSGAVLLKPDMGHVETDPDIYLPWETHVPLAWDLSDLPETLRRRLGDAPLRERIATRAFDRLRDWAASDRFARTLAPLLVA